MSSQESDRFRWDFLLRLAASAESTTSELIDASSGQLIRSGVSAHFDRNLVSSLLAQAQRSQSPSEIIRALGRILSDVALPNSVEEYLRECAAVGPLRIGLQFDSSDLAEAPWECAVLRSIPETAIGLYPNVHVYRRFDSAKTAGSSGFLTRVLLVMADPQSAAYPALASGSSELHSVVHALSSPECRAIRVTQLRFATPSSLERSLKEQSPDVVHFVCHGDVMASGGVLVLESDRPHKESLLYADELTKMIRTSGTRLVVLSGCFTAGSVTTVGGALVSAGVDAVVGMQTPVSDIAAHLFSRAMYAALAEGAPLEIAVDQGRASISGTGLDWAAPTAMISSQGSAGFLPAEVAGMTSRRKSKHNIPIEERPFVGRALERSTLAKLIEKPDSRLITITGMGGMGKTRLAKRVALDLVDGFLDGVWLVECEAITLEEELVASVSGATGLDADTMSETAMLEAFRGKNLLLVFDCFERIAGFAGLIPRILQFEAGIKAVVTSRILLGVPFEREFTLDPMSLRKQRARTAEGLQLFEEVAGFTDSTFKLTRKNQKLVEALVQDLEAVPLAIVLAAGRLRHMSLQELAERVRSQRLDVLRRRPTGPGDRHADLLRVVGDSLSLLFEGDRALVKSLSVFQGGFFRDDAVAVLGPKPEVLDGISLLRDHSLLMSQIVDSRMRFRILDTIREYLDRIPDDDEIRATRTRHAQHFAALAAGIRESFDNGRYGAAREQLSLDIGNYRVGVQWAVSSGDQDLIRRYARSLARVYFETGASQEFELLAASAQAVATQDDLDLLCELYGLQGEFFRRNNRSDAAIEIWQRRIEVCVRLGRLNEQVDTLFEIARLALLLGKDDLAKQMLDEFSTLRSRLTDLPLLATGIALQAQYQVKSHSLVEAISLCRELEEMLKSVRVDPQALFVWMSLARLYREAGELEDGLRSGQRCLADSLESSHLMTAAQTLLELSRSHEGLGDDETAARLLAIALVIPTGLWPALREQTQLRRSEFERGGGTGLLEQAIAAVGKADWEVLAWREVPEELRTART
jgi:predicted ATPase